MLEMLFFASLGITFVMIVFLVYQFRQKFTNLEHKCDTMFEIINNMVKEMNHRTTLMDVAQFAPNNLVLNSHSSHNDDMPKLLVSDSEEEDSHDEDSDDEDSDDEDSSDEDSRDEDSSEDEELCMIIPDTFEIDDPVRIINVNITNIDNEISQIDENEDSNPASDTEPMNGSELIIEEIESIQVEKLTESTLENVNDGNVEPNKMDMYRKMNITALRALVIENGYITDTGKMKKPDLLKLLEPSA